MKSNLEFPDFIEVEDSGPEVLGDAFGKFIEENAVAATINHPRAHALLESFRATSAERNKPMVEHYAKIAAAATKTTPAPAATLAKGMRKIIRGDAGDKRRVLRTETCHYPLTGVSLVSEIAETGEIIRIFEVKDAA